MAKPKRAVRKRKPKADPRIAGLNRRNAEFWEAETKKRDAQLEKHSRDAAIAAEHIEGLAAEVIEAQKKRDEAAGIRGLKRAPSVESALKLFDKVRSADQRDRARHSRPKCAPTVKSVVIERMRHARAEENTLADFIEAACAGSVDDIVVTKSTRPPLRYTFDCDAGLKRIAQRTLEAWWREAQSAG